MGHSPWCPRSSRGGWWATRHDLRTCVPRGLRLERPPKAPSQNPTIGILINRHGTAAHPSSGHRGPPWEEQLHPLPGFCVLLRPKFYQNWNGRVGPISSVRNFHRGTREMLSTHQNGWRDHAVSPREKTRFASFKKHLFEKRPDFSQRRQGHIPRRSM